MVRPRNKNVIVILGCLLGGLLLPPGAFSGDSPEELYRAGYLHLKQAERSFYERDYEQAVAGYESAEKFLGKVKDDYPEWSPDTIEARLNKCRKRLEETESLIAEKKSWEKPLKVHFIDVGQGDCELIQCPDGSTILIDGGRIWVYPFLIEYLRGAGVEKIDLLVVSHPHGDHYGGIIKILNTFPVTTLLVSGKEDTTEHYERYLETVRSHDEIQFKAARAGDIYSFGDVKLSILHPSSRLLDSPNNCSIIAKLAYGEDSYLFTGDAEAEAEQETVSRAGTTLKSRVMKVAHHGSKTSTTPEFLSRVSPRTAVIPVGAENSYGHPAPQVLRRLEMRRITVYRTDLQGTILFLSNGREQRVEFPGPAFYPEYDIPEKMLSTIIANRETLIYYLPQSLYARRIPPEDRVYFDTTVAAETAGYRRYWY